MAPRSARKRAAPFDEEDDAPTPTQSYRNRARDPSPDENADGTAMDVDDGEYGNNGSGGSGSLPQLAKGLVRYALACEFARKPIKRQDVNERVLGSHGARSFKLVFEQANTELMDVFGMQMVELPNREKVTMRQKRAAAASESQNKTSNMWVLQNILPEQYRLPEIIGPSRAPLEDHQIDKEGAYVGLYTMIISLILLSGGSIADSKLDRYLKRMNADQSTPVDSKDKLLNMMIKDGYIVRVKDSSSGEETVDYIVGPRGKLEVGQEGVANLVRRMYGDEVEDLEQRLTRSLGIVEASEVREGGEASATASQAGPRRSGRPRRNDDDDGYE